MDERKSRERKKKKKSKKEKGPFVLFTLIPSTEGQASLRSKVARGASKKRGGKRDAKQLHGPKVVIQSTFTSQKLKVMKG